MNNKHKTHESPKPKTESLRTKIICDLHKIFCDDFESDDMELTQAAMNAVIKHHKLKFLEPRDIDACFFLLDISDIENSFMTLSTASGALTWPTSRYSARPT